MDLPDDLALPLRSGQPYWYWLGGRLSADFVNTLRERWWRNVETLVTPDDLVRWLELAELLPPDGRVAASPARLDDARALREAIDAGIVAITAAGDVPAASLETIDRWLPAAGVARTIGPGPDGAPLLRDAAPAEPIAHALGRIALDAATLLGSDDRARARICASETCSARFYDRSPTAGRRWCSMRGCGNVAKARRHRARAKQIDRPVSRDR
jgi:predicted RNA-binding Zn ribbon-like protein